MEIISEREVIRRILRGTTNKDVQARMPRFVCYLGAGASAEAGVKTAWEICNDIRNELKIIEGFTADTQDRATKQKLRKWEADLLKWNDPTLKYSACIRAGYPSEPERIRYFRDLLQGSEPSFCHHAIALLTSRRYFKNTCLTTNFDKLVENSYIRQGSIECQPIRSDTEAENYWEDDRYYIIKLHGDYDTYNILNTQKETTRINDSFLHRVERVLQDAGLIVIGAAGFEKSVHTMFDYLWNKAQHERQVLRYGLYWGVYMGSSKPTNLSTSKMKELLRKRVQEDRVVSRDIESLIENMDSDKSYFCFFPIWGAGNFFFDLIREADQEDSGLFKTAELYMDRTMRLRHTFQEKAGLSQEAINKHIAELDKKRTLPKLSDSDGPQPESVYKAVSTASALEIRVLYGDISHRKFMQNEEFWPSATNNPSPKRLAIVSPEDTLITAGGGVAEILLRKAGTQFILNEMVKLSPVKQEAIAVTSAGNLPLHYIFHAAAIEVAEVNKGVSYSVSEKSVYNTVVNILNKALALEVGYIWLPLLATGVAGLKFKQSLDNVVSAIKDWEAINQTRIVIMIFIFKEGLLPRNEVFESLKRILGVDFTIQSL